MVKDRGKENPEIASGARKFKSNAKNYNEKEEGARRPGVCRRNGKIITVKLQKKFIRKEGEIGLHRRKVV